MLFRTTYMINRKVSNFSIATNEIGRLTMNVNYWKTFFTLKYFHKNYFSIRVFNINQVLKWKHELRLVLYLHNPNTKLKIIQTLNGYKRHRAFGSLASGGSLYLIITPLNMFVSSKSFPLVSKQGFSRSSSLSVFLCEEGKSAKCKYCKYYMFYYNKTKDQKTYNPFFGILLF